MSELNSSDLAKVAHAYADVVSVTLSNQDLPDDERIQQVVIALEDTAAMRANPTLSESAAAAAMCALVLAAEKLGVARDDLIVAWREAIDQGTTA